MEWWQWLIDILGVVAFLMGIYSLLYIWGKPKIKVTFEDSAGYRLWCRIRNMPVSGFLLWFNITRRQPEIAPTVIVTDQDETIIYTTYYPLNMSNDIRLPIASVKSSGDGEVFLCDTNGQYTLNVLKSGIYKVVLELYGDDRLLQKKARLFRVNEAKPFIQLLRKRTNAQ